MKVDKDGIVRLIVESDREVQVRVTGYETELPAGPDEPARFEFRAARSGAFPVVLTTSGLEIARLVVSD